MYFHPSRNSEYHATLVLGFGGPPSDSDECSSRFFNSLAGISHTENAETRNDAALTTNAVRYPTVASAMPPSAAPADMSRNLDENMSAVPAKRPSSPVIEGSEAFFAPSKKAASKVRAAVHEYAI